jgi:hypothetical protein
VEGSFPNSGKISEILEVELEALVRRLNKDTARERKAVVRMITLRLDNGQKSVCIKIQGNRQQPERVMKL